MTCPNSKGRRGHARLRSQAHLPSVLGVLLDHAACSPSPRARRLGDAMLAPAPAPPGKVGHLPSFPFCSSSFGPCGEQNAAPSLQESLLSIGRQSIGGMTELRLNVGDIVGFATKKRNQLRTCPPSALHVPVCTSGEWTGVSEPGPRPPSSTKAITPGPRPAPVPTPLSSFRRHRRVPTTCRAPCGVWVARAKCRPLGGHAMKTQEGWGNLPKEVTLTWGCEGGQVGLS